MATIHSGAVGLDKYHPALLDGYKQAKEAGMPVEPIHSSRVAVLKGIPDSLQQTVRRSNMIIDLLVANLLPLTSSKTKVNIHKCITDALHQSALED